MKFVNALTAVAPFPFYETVRPDVVLMNISLGATDGLAATRRIIEQFPAARIVVVTNFDEEALREEAKNAGGCGYVLSDVDFL